MNRSHCSVGVLVLTAALLCAGCRSAYQAASDGERDRVRYLLKHGQPIDARFDRDRTMLHAAARNGHDRLVAVLLSEGAAVNLQDADGATPLHLAAARGHSDTCRLLLEGGADRTIRSALGQTPEEAAADSTRWIVRVPRATP